MSSLSPQVQSYGEVPAPEQAEKLFKDRFTQIAYSVLFAKFADLAHDLVTFKVLDTSPEEGKGVGAFVIMRNDRPIYVPAVMIDGQLKPMEMFYYKDLNIFLPLDNAWLDEISKMNLDEMGDAAKIPDDVPRDMGIRNLVMPPIAPGRYGYASDHSHNIKKMLKEARDHSIDIHPKFLEAISNAPKVVLDGVKIAFERNPQILQKLAAVYGTTALARAFSDGYAKVKEAEEKVPGVVQVLTNADGADKIKEVFGEKAAEAFSEILKSGYAVQDTRGLLHKIAVKIEGKTCLDSPGSQGGWFRLYFVDAPADLFFVIPWPKSASRYTEYTPRDESSTHRVPVEYLVINKDGKEAWTCSDVMGEPIYDVKEVKGTRLYKLLADKDAGDTPSPDSYGFFLNVTNKVIEATKPMRVRFNVDEGGRKKVVGYYSGPTYVIDDDPSRICIDTLKKHDLGFVPKNSKWVEITKIKRDSDGSIDDTDYASSEAYQKRRRTSVIKDPKLMERWMNAKLQKSEANPVRVKSAGYEKWWIENSPYAYRKTEALVKIATDYGITVEDAEGILKDASENVISTAYVLDSRSGRAFASELHKIAQPPMDPAMMGGAMPPGPAMGGMPPEMGGMPPDMMGGGASPMIPMQQSPLSPTDLAIAETVDGLKQQNELQIQQQQQQMEMGQQQTQQLIGVLEHIQQRSREISGATGGMVPAGAEGAPAAAAGMLAPPATEEIPPPPTPVMEGENISPEDVANQINPEMVDQAADFQDQGVFDTAALAMLSTAPALQDIVATYIPNMEKCLDNLGRILLTLWLTESETKEAIGDETYITLEDKLRTIFKGLGDVILSISHNAPGESAQGQTGSAADM